MVIFIAGNIGTGKTTIAQHIAKIFNIIHYDVDEAKKIIYPTDPHFKENLEKGIPIGDELREKTFRYVATRFRELSLSNQHLVVDETLHKEKLRKILFDAADEYFHGHLLLWVISPEEQIRERLTKISRSNHILKNPLLMYEGIKKQYEPFVKYDLLIENTGKIEEAVKTAATFIKNKLH
jgi:gluconate kinase